MHSLKIQGALLASLMFFLRSEYQNFRITFLRILRLCIYGKANGDVFQAFSETPILNEYRNCRDEEIEHKAAKKTAVTFLLNYGQLRELSLTKVPLIVFLSIINI